MNERDNGTVGEGGTARGATTETVGAAGAAANGAAVGAACGASPLGVTSLAAVALTSLGTGLYLGWQLIDISPTLFPTPGEGVHATLDSVAYLATALLVTLLILFALLARRRGPLLGRTWIVALASFGPALGTTLLYLCGWVAEQPLMAGVVAGRLLYAASAGFVVLWGELICRVPSQRMLACVAGGYGVAFGVCLLEANLGPTAALVFRPLLPLLSGATLALLRFDLTSVPSVAAKAGGAAAETSSGEVAGAGGFRYPVRIFVGTGILGAIFIATNHLSETKTEVSTELYTLIAGIAVSVAILAVALVTRRRHERFALLYRLITPLVIGSLLLILVLEPERQRYEALAIGCAWSFFRIFTWTLWGRLGARDVRRGACVFAVGQVALTLCSTAGELLCSVVDLTAVPVTVSAAAIIFVTVMTSAFVMDDGRVAATADAVALAGEGSGNAVGDEAAVDADPSSRAGAGPTGAGSTAVGLVVAGQTGLRLDDVAAEEIARATAGSELSERECGIALLVLRRLDNGAICREACITESTLRTHLRNIYGKLDVHSRAELIELLEERLTGRPDRRA